MLRFFKNTRRQVGLPPGTAVYTGDDSATPLLLSVFKYAPGQLEENEYKSLDEVLQQTEQEGMQLWINLDGINHADKVQQLCKAFRIHPLTIEDILSADQRPKVEENPEYLYVVLKMLTASREKRTVHVEQVSFVLGKNFVLSFQETQGDTFEPVRNRLRIGRGRIRKFGPDYLLYALVDTVVDNYFVVLETFGDYMEDLEVELLKEANEDTLNKLYELKREMLSVRRSVWPLREVIHKLERADLKMVRKETRPYMRDVYDHTIQVIDTVETYRDMLNSMVDLYQSTISNRMNNVMKVLTIISTIFIPLTFIAGVYGMNFENMPELDWRFGYPAVWIIMIVTTLAMVLLFKRKDWL